MVKRYELNDAQWRRVEAMLPGKAGDPGRTANNRLFVDGVLWVLRSVAHLHDLPERYGKGKALTPAFRAGPRPACGSAFSRLSPKTAATNISCSTQPWFALTNRPRPEKGGPKSGSGAFPRRIDHQNPYARRRAWPPVALHPDRRPNP
jgi:transposase